MTGVELLRRAHGLHPAAKRVPLIACGDVASGFVALQRCRSGSSTTGNTPSGPPELRLYPAMAGR